MYGAKNGPTAWPKGRTMLHIQSVAVDQYSITEWWIRGKSGRDGESCLPAQPTWQTNSWTWTQWIASSWPCTRGTQTRIQSNREDQLVVASKQIKDWNYSRVRDWAGKNGIERHLVPTGGQTFNGQAERIIWTLKNKSIGASKEKSTCMRRHVRSCRRRPW